MSRRIIVPKGLVNPDGTTIIEIPEELKDERQLIATFKTHASNSSFQSRTRKSYSRIAKDPREDAQLMDYDQIQGSFRPQRSETPSKKPVEPPKITQVMMSRSPSGSKENKEGAKADETHQNTPMMSKFTDDDFSSVKFQPKFMSTEEVTNKTEREGSCQGKCKKGTRETLGRTYLLDRELDTTPPRRRVSSQASYNVDLTPDMSVYPANSARVDYVDVTCEYLNPQGANCEFHNRCSKSSMKRQASCQSSKTSSVGSGVGLGVFMLPNFPDDVEKELQRMEAEERLQIERNLAKYQQARRMLVASTTMSDKYREGKRCKSPRPTPYCP